MAYVPSITNSSLPDDTIIAETAQAEFRLIKSLGRWKLYRRSTILVYANTLALNDIFPAFSIGAGILLTNQRVNIRVEGIYINDTGATQNIEFKFYYGTTILSQTIAQPPTNADSGAWEYEVDFGNNNAANLQSAKSKVTFYTPPSAQGQIGPIGINGSGGAYKFGITENSAGALNVSGTVQMGVANANLTISIGLVEIEFY